MTDLTPFTPATAKAVDDSAEIPIVGRWYWYRSEPDVEPVLHCCVHVGSNYVGLRRPGDDDGDDDDLRVHHDAFWDVCTFEPAALTYVAGRVQAGQQRVQALLEEVRSVTARLAVSVDVLPGAAAAQDGQALALYAGGQVDSYEKSLVLAKDETLPELFKKIKSEQKGVATWLTAQLIPLQAEADRMQPAIQKIAARIESVGLYAGLTEHIATIRDGEPAATTEPVHVFQRKAYMDEECLARYETGGMDIKDLEAFDAWLTRPSNLDRLMPYPRCVLAFQVRRNVKTRHANTIAGFFAVMEESKYDKYTFLYIRNGQQVHRLRTSIEFDANLFPDQEHNILDGRVYFRVRSGELVSEAQYADLVAAAQEEDRENARRKRESDRGPKKDRWHYHAYDSARRDLHGVEAVGQASVYYDDAVLAIQAEMARHNRMVLVLQGLLDRSTVLHPHPPWRLWSPEGFQAGLRLIYDGVRTLAVGDKPDFEAYRAGLNAQLKPGSVTVGQHYMWDMRETNRYEAEQERRYPSRHGRSYSRFDNDVEGLVRADARKAVKHAADPGPGWIARVFAKKGEGCEFRWLRQPRNVRETSDTDVKVLDTIVVKADRLLNLSAYQAGDMRRFFDDPRTRADYLAWAPALIVAEEYAAGNLTIQEPAMPPPKKPRGPIDQDAKRKREDLRARKALMGHVVELSRPITTVDNCRYPAGSFWYVDTNERGGLIIEALDDQYRFITRKGQYGQVRTRIGGMRARDLSVRHELKEAFRAANKDTYEARRK